MVRVGLVALAFELGRETRGPSVVAASDGAVEDLYARHEGDSSGATPCGISAA
jgi:hypothetical protein